MSTKKQVGPDFGVPNPINLPKKDVFDIAEKIAHMLDFKVGDPLEPIVKRLGGKIEYQDLNAWLSEESGAIRVRGNKDFTIYLSNFTGPLRDRFTIAHELGHYVLHSKFGEQPIRVARGGSDRVEWEANWFAAGFLMPAAKFELACKKNNDPVYLANKFNVSIAAAKVRMKGLGCGG